MKNLAKISLAIVFLTLASCVQKSYKQTVHFFVDVKGIKNVKTVGLRGKNPLSWQQDLDMKIGKDSIYEQTVVFDTGYKFAEFKFTVNGEYEFQDQENRKVYFDEDKNTEVRLVYNKRDTAK